VATSEKAYNSRVEIFKYANLAIIRRAADIAALLKA
jgi:hypothetical protein